MKYKLLEEDIIGKKHNHLYIKEIVRREKNSHIMVLVLCDCGKEKIINLNNIRTGVTKTCGCKAGNRSHNLSKTNEYQTWATISQRCYNTKNTVYRHYGGKGITVCDEWRNSFEQFYRDMGPRPEGCSLDRIDPNKGYEPNNCRWTDIFVQNINKSIVIDTLKSKYPDIYKILRDKKIIL